MTLTTDLTGRVALVTGASSGFGHRFARVLAASGAEVIVAARRASALEELVAEITAAGGKARAAPLDVTDPAAIAETISALPALDIVINNAGVAGESIAIDCEADEWRWTYDVNVHGVFFVARQAALKMREQGRGGSIVNIASMNAYAALPWIPAYCASKGGVVMLTKSLAIAWAGEGIRVNALAPGSIEFPGGRWAERREQDPALYQRIRASIPFGDFGQVDAVADAALFLCSPAASWISGQILTVSGGGVQELD